MLKYSKAELNRQAKELGFVRDTFEKVCRLTDVLTYMESDPLQAGCKISGVTSASTMV